MPEVAYGFVGLQDLFDQRVSQVGVARIYTAVEESTAEYSRVVLALIAEFATPTMVAQEQIELPGGGTLQPIGPDGNPLPEKPTGSYKAAWPIQGGGTAWGTNRVTDKLLTVAEANRFILEASRKDADWNIRHILAALLDNAGWTYHDKTGGSGGRGLGEIQILPLANDDDVRYVQDGAVEPAKADHYRAQAGAISDADNPFEEAREILQSYPSNGKAEIICYIAKNLKKSIQGLTDFVEVRDPEVRASLVTAYVDAEITDNIGPGTEYVGKMDRIKIIVLKRLPDNYMIFKVAGKPCLRMRQYPVSSLQGLFPELSDIDGNHKDIRLIRFAGYGVSDRLCALIWQIESDDYEVPAGFETPLPV